MTEPACPAARKSVLRRVPARAALPPSTQRPSHQLMALYSLAEHVPGCLGRTPPARGLRSEPSWTGTLSHLPLRHTHAVGGFTARLDRRRQEAERAVQPPPRSRHVLLGRRCDEGAQPCRKRRRHGAHAARAACGRSCPAIHRACARSLSRTGMRARSEPLSPHRPRAGRPGASGVCLRQGGCYACAGALVTHATHPALGAALTLKWCPGMCGSRGRVCWRLH